MSVPGRDRGLPRGIVASSVTPFNADGSVALHEVHRHIDWLLAEGAAGISPLGSSGEFPSLECDERKAVLDASMEAIAGRTPVLAGTHHYSTRRTIELSIHAEKAGADALLIVPPYYMLPSRTQVMDHYRAVASAVSIPIVLYHNVGNTGVDLSSEDIVALYEEGALAGVKWSDPRAGRIFELLEASSGGLTVYVGVDTIAFEGLCYGAHGWISGVPSMVPGAAGRLYEALAVDQDLARAREEWRRLLPLVQLEFGGTATAADPQWFSVMKAALRLLIGPEVGEPAAPIQPLAPEHEEVLQKALMGLGYLVGKQERRMLVDD